MHALCLHTHILQTQWQDTHCQHTHSVYLHQASCQKSKQVCCGINRATQLHLGCELVALVATAEDEAPCCRIQPALAVCMEHRRQLFACPAADSCTAAHLSDVCRGLIDASHDARQLHTSIPLGLLLDLWKGGVTMQTQPSLEVGTSVHHGTLPAWLDGLLQHKVRRELQGCLAKLPCLAVAVHSVCMCPECCCAPPAAGTSPAPLPGT